MSEERMNFDQQESDDLADEADDSQIYDDESGDEADETYDDESGDEADEIYEDESGDEADEIYEDESGDEADDQQEETDNDDEQVTDSSRGIKRKTTSPSSAPPKKERRADVKWTTLEHNGVLLAPPYEPLPSDVKLRYEGTPMVLSEEAEEVATLYAKMLDKRWTKREDFNNNFFKSWKSFMTEEEWMKITDLKKCDFGDIARHFKDKRSEDKEKNKEKNKEKKNQESDKYGYCTVDRNKETVLSYRVPGPRLIRSHGNNPDRGKVIRRIQPEDITINIEHGRRVEPPTDHEWKEVVHNQKTLRLAWWKEEIREEKGKMKLAQTRFIFAARNDKNKFDTAGKLMDSIPRIRKKYEKDLKDNDEKIQQRAVAIYIIDNLSIRVGNEKDKESQDIVGCCTLRVEHIKLKEDQDGLFMEFDFLGKSSIPFMRTLRVRNKKKETDKAVFENLKQFMKDKELGAKLFDKLTAVEVNKYLKDLMEGLTAKVFRTCNASLNMKKELDERTRENMTKEDKLLAFKEAANAVARHCNHVRKGGDGEYVPNRANTLMYYIDPRIVVEWCERWVVPIEEVYTEAQRHRFHWAIKTRAAESVSQSESGGVDSCDPSGSRSRSQL